MPDNVRFAFTDDEWAKIAAEIPNCTDELRACMEDRTAWHVRRIQLATGKTWHSAPPGPNWAWLRGCASVLERHLSGLPLHSYPGNLSLRSYGGERAAFDQFVAYLPTLVKLCEYEISLTDHEGPHPRRSPFHHVRDSYFAELLAFWETQGGALRTSVKDGTPDGPLIRYLLAASLPSLIAAGAEPPSPNAARHIVRRIRADVRAGSVEIHEA